MRRCWTVLGIALALTLAACPDDEPGPTGDADVTSDVSPDQTGDVPPDLGPDTEDVPDAEPDVADVEVEDAPDVDDVADVEDVQDVPDVEDVQDVPDVPTGVTPAAGDLVLTELMINPVVVSDLAGEWIELTNVSGEALDLTGCVLRDEGSESVSLDGAPVVPAGARFVVGPEADTALNGGVAVDFAFTGTFKLSNLADEVVVECGTTTIDSVAYDAAGDPPFPLLAGFSSSFSAAADQTAEANDDPAAWCSAQEDDVYSGTNHGTPGAANPVCAVVEGTLDGCEVVAPVDATVLAASPLDFEVRLFEPGVTDKTPFVDPIVGLKVQAGWGPDGTDPSADDSAWTWVEGGPVDGWTDTSGDGEDAYGATADAPAPGSWLTAFRVSLDGGATWALCDTTAAPGFDVAAAGTLTTVPNPCEPNPCTAPPASSCIDDLLIAWPSPGACAVDEDLEAQCTYTKQEIDCAAVLATCVDGACTDGPEAPIPGEVVIREILIEPEATGDPEGEWFEVVNVGTEAVDIDGCELSSGAGEVHTIASAGPVALMPGVPAVLARSATGNGISAVKPVWIYGDALTFDAEDSLTLTCGSDVIDTVAWDAAFLDAGALPAGGPGVAIQLSEGLDDTTSNDLGVNWCSAVTAFGSGDLGTPGAANLECLYAIPVERCRLQGPASVTVDATVEVTWEGRILQPGTTDQTTGVDVDEDIVGQLAYGPDGADPTTDVTGWTFTDAAPVADWDDAADPGFDAYSATIDAPAEGEYDVAFRFSADGGLTWTWCDLDTGVTGEDGSENGYQVANAGALTTDPYDPCDPDPCDDPPDDFCTGDVATLHDAAGSCTVGPDGAECAYATTDVDCAALAGSCDAGACVGVAGPPVAADEVAITELMVLPALGAGGDGQWIEVHNTTGIPLDLFGCELQHASGTATLGHVVMLAGERAVLGYGPGALIDGTWGDVSPGLVLDASEVSLVCGATVIDAVDAGAAGFPEALVGRSLQVDPATVSGPSEVWCSSLTDAGGFFGTPGEVNEACPIVDAVDYCRMDAPVSFLGFTFEPIAWSGVVEVAGVTDLTPGIDAAPALLAQVGWGPDGTDPDGNAAWAWMDAAADDAWDDAGGPDAGRDGYLASVGVSMGGNLDAAMRFSLDAGRTWTFCDLSGSNPPGYQTADAGELVIVDPCEPNPCTDPPDDVCSGDDLSTYPAVGDCSHSAGFVSCEYEETVTDCAALPGGACEAGMCMVPPPPAAGELVIAEIMASPTTEGDEWLEVVNVSGLQLDLAGCRLSDDAGTAEIAQTWLVDAGAIMVWSAADITDGLDVQPDWIYGGLAPSGDAIDLGDSGDALSIECPDGLGGYVTVDAVTYSDAAPWPDQAGGASIQIEAGATASDNDDGANWCVSASGPLPNGDVGTPSVGNPQCP